MLMKAPLSESFHLVEAAANFWAAGTFRKPCHFSFLSIALIFRWLLLHTATIWSNPCWHCCMLNAHNGNTHLRLLKRKWKSSHAHASLLSECHTVLIKSRLFSINRLFILGKEEGTCESFQESLSLALSCCLCLWKLLKHTFAVLLRAKWRRVIKACMVACFETELDDKAGWWCPRIRRGWNLTILVNSWQQPRAPCPFVLA